MLLFRLFYGLTISLLFLQPISTLAGVPCEHMDIKRPIIKGVSLDGLNVNSYISTILNIKSINTTWISLEPSIHSRSNTTSILYDTPRHHWRESSEGIRDIIAIAKNYGLKVMINPKLVLLNTNEKLQQKTEADWIRWEKNYIEFITIYAKMAEELSVNILSIGSGLDDIFLARPLFTKKIILEVRKHYKGELIYSADWNTFHKLTLWHDLDFIGINGYFPLSEERNPSVDKLKIAWATWVDKLRYFSQTYRKKIVFSEYGYMAIDNCTAQNIPNLKIKKDQKLNLHAQKNALEALWQVLSKESFWAGGFLKKWIPEDHIGITYKQKVYSVKDRPAEEVIKNWFLKIF